MTIYLDIIFFENLFMNYIILYTTGIILRKKLSYLRIFFASALGSVYVVVAYTTKTIELYGLILKILLSVAIVYIAFKPKSFKLLIKQILFFYLVSFVYGGTAFAMVYCIKPQKINIKNGVYVGKYIAGSIGIGMIVGFTLLSLAFKFIKKKISKEDMCCRLKIIFQDKTEMVDALIDTGNMLKDPISGYPVVIVEKEILNNILPNIITDNVKNILEGRDIFLSYDEKEYMRLLRFIPYSSLGNEHRNDSWI